MIRVRIQYRDMTDKQCKKFWQDYPEENSAGYKYTDPDILDAVWEQWNNGSGKECDLFKKLEVRSMMVGDYVSILRPTVASVWHECLPFGWRINVPWEEIYGDKPKDKTGHKLTHDELVEKIMKQIKGLDKDEISFAE